jgi:hypothetical protein
MPERNTYSVEKGESGALEVDDHYFPEDYGSEVKAYEEAKLAALKIGGRVVCHVWEWTDSYMVDDFTGQGAGEED